MNYSEMHLQTQEDEPSGFVSSMRPFVDCESMDVGNDPRFFQGSVVDKRLGAFAGLGVVSGLMVDAALDQVMSSSKNFDWATANGCLQFAGFVLMSMVLFANLLSTYIAVAQLYHTMRLMTGGALGFEMCAAYYLNKNIVFWRHFAVKCMLTSLPVLLASMAMKLLVKFNQDSTDSGATLISEADTESHFAPSHPHMYGCSLSGFITFIVYSIAGLCLYCVHVRHTSVFREKYAFIGSSVPFLSNSSMMRHDKRMKIPDV